MSEINTLLSLPFTDLSEHKEEILNTSYNHDTYKTGEFWKRFQPYKDVSREVFLNHKWQLKNSVTSVSSLMDLLGDIPGEAFINDLQEGFDRAPMAVRITPYVLSLIDWNNPYEDPLRRQFLPISSRLQKDHPELHLDTLNEQSDAPVPGLTHRYPDKALFLALDTCPVYCRYCTRSYAVGLDTKKVEKVRLAQSKKRWEGMFEYLDGHETIEDVVISGGDAYMLKASNIELIGERLLNMPNIRRIRIATKGLAILPQKILSDNAWYEAVRKLNKKGRRMHKEVAVHTHFSQPNEITEITERALNRFMEDGITVRNQAVLQRGVNDTPYTMTLLTKRLSYINVQPYYVYMHDLVKGVEDLRTPLSTGLDIEKWLRGATAGFNTPTFVVDAPGGGGKRAIHSYEYYNPETGISVYTAPAIKPGEHFMYFDPINSLSEDIQEAWHDPKRRTEMKMEALDAAKNGRY